MTPKNASNKKVTYKSSNKKIVSVSKTGKIKALKKGQVTITVTAKGNKKKKAKLKVTVKEPVIKVTSVKVTPATAKIGIGKTVSLAAAVSPNNANKKTVTWSSSNTRVAAVSASGLVTGVSAGTVTITATANDGSGKKGSCTVTVEHGILKKITGLELSGTGLVATDGLYSLSIPNGISKEDVVVKLTALNITAATEDGTTLNNIKTTAASWEFYPAYDGASAGEYRATAKVSAPNGYTFGEGVNNTLEVVVSVAKKKITATSISGLVDGTITVDNGTVINTVRTQLTALSITGTVEGETEPLTFTTQLASWTFSPAYNANPATQTTYTARYTLSAPDGYEFADGVEAVSIPVRVKAPIKITSITLASGSNHTLGVTFDAGTKTLSVPYGTTKETVMVELVKLGITAAVESGVVPTYTNAADLWTLISSYNGTLPGNYNATASLAAPSGLAFAPGVNPLSVIVKVLPYDGTFTITDITFKCPGATLTDDQYILEVLDGTTEEEVLAILGAGIVETVIEEDVPAPAIANSADKWEFTEEYNPQQLRDYTARTTLALPDNATLQGVSSTLQITVRVILSGGEPDEIYGIYTEDIGFDITNESTTLDAIRSNPVWNDVPWIEFGRYTTISRSNARAKCKILWDENYIYTLMEIHKFSFPVLYNENRVPANMYQHDSVEFHINEGPTTSTSYEAAGVAENGDNLALRLQVDSRGNQEVFGSPGLEDLAKARRFASKAGTYGDYSYVIVSRIALAEVIDDPMTVKDVGFEISVNVAHASDRAGRLSLLEGSDSAWQNPSTFGILHLVQQAVPEQ